MVSNGWVSLHRDILNKPIFENEKLLKVFIWCLLKATHKEHKQLVGRQNARLIPGQFITGRNKAGIELCMPPSTAWEYLKVLENNGTINIKSNNKYSVVSIENWGLYQNINESSDNKQDNKSTTNQQQINTNNNDNNVNNKYSYQNSHFDIAKKLQSLILEYNPKNKCATANLDKWSNEIRLLQEKDKRTNDEIGDILEYIFNIDDFWNSQIQSPANLRKHWDKIYPKVKNKSKTMSKEKDDNPYSHLPRYGRS